ncbi:GumC family protein [Bradyrhizobium sp.]|uniref:GumC family protein n=1 Tax=Bradyrhizobium sp. TaxID=376 RepID=UPI0040383DD6
MMYGNKPAQVASDRVEDAPSWEAPARTPSGKSASAQPAFLKGYLAVNGLTFFRNNAKRIAVYSLALFALGVAVLMMLPLRYAATALVVVDPREQRVTNEQDVLPGIGQDAAALQSLIEIAKSDGFLRPLIAQLKIGEDADIAGSETDPAKILDRFRARLDISRRGLTYVIAITFVSNNPQKASSYANAIAEAFVGNQTQARTSATDEAADWLNSRLKTLSDRLRVSEDSVAKFKREYKILYAGKDATTQQLRITDLTQQVSAARLKTEEAKTRYEQAQRDLKANVDGPVKQDLLSALRAQRSVLNDQIAQKRAVLGDRHPDLVMALGQLADLNRQIEVERKRSIETARSEYETLQDQQKTLEGQLKAAEGQALTDAQALVKLQELQRDAEANKNIYEQFLARYKTTNEQRLLQSSQTRIASLANPPTRPTRPSLAILLVAIALASVLTSTAAVAVLEARKSAAPVAAEQAPAAAPAPAVPAAPPAQVEQDLPVWVRIPNALPPDTRKTVWQKPIRRFAEPDLRPHVAKLLERVAAMPGRRGKIALVTALEPGAGVSTVARSLNLGAVDRGMMSVLIEVQPDSAVIRACDAADGAGSQFAAKATLRSLDILLGASRIATSSEDDIRAEFSLIVIDTPSLAEQPGVAALAAHADLVVLVAHEHAARSGAIHDAITSLSKVGPAAIGVVLNDVALRPVPLRAQAS